MPECHTQMWFDYRRAPDTTTMFRANTIASPIRQSNITKILCICLSELAMQFAIEIGVHAKSDGAQSHTVAAKSIHSSASAHGDWD